MTREERAIARLREYGDWDSEATIARAMLAFAAEVVAKEREECAKVAEARMPAVQCMSVAPAVVACEDIATAIRARRDDV